jgi:E3 ubiquitin-protein ligase TRIP12
VDKILALAGALHAFDPAMPMHCPEFEQRLSVFLRSSLFPIVAGFSAVSAIIFRHPYLFSVRLKADLFRLTSLDIYSAMSFAHTYLFKNEKKLIIGRSFCSDTVRRDHLREDGALLLKRFGPGQIQVELIFAGEAGIGSGLMREFMDLFARELARKDLRLWRDTSPPSSEYAFTNIDLFPRPDADPEMFYVLGLLCGKALAMNAALPLPLSAQFFRLIAGDRLEIANIDQQFASSLSQRADLILADMPFLYPGIDTLPLVANGADIYLTEDNYDSFLELVREFTCGAKLAPIVAEFTRGLFSVVQDGVWDCLTAQEKALMITGHDGAITMKTLEENIVFEHGYNAKCLQKTMLLQVIAEMTDELRQKLWMFITRCERLPIGGLAALVPKITLARRVPDQGMTPDETLPTASTCVHYLKLPPYSSKQIMRDRLALAITEGCVGFELS